MAPSKAPADLPVLSTKRFVLKPLQKNDVGGRYLEWMRDEEITRFLYAQHREQTIESIQEYVSSFDNISSFLFGIFVTDTKPLVHIGNITLRCNLTLGNGMMGAMIGDKEYWGHAVVLEVREKLLEFAFDTLELFKISGGCAATNAPAIYNYRRQKWQMDGIQKLHTVMDGKRVDVVNFAMFRDDWLSR
jgi:[ribosomal protein S5]-alanine N-acetyltransferase